MSTHFPKIQRGWTREDGPGYASVWSYQFGPRFRVDMQPYTAVGRRLFCYVDGEFFAMTHVNPRRVRFWVEYFWHRHLAELTGHERMDYIHLGLVTE